jgi:hypothetical protein
MQILFVFPLTKGIAMEFWSVAWMVSIIFVSVMLLTTGLVMYITNGEKHGVGALAIAVMCAAGLVTALVNYYYLTTKGYTTAALVSIIIAGLIGAGLLKRAYRIKKRSEARL